MKDSQSIRKAKRYDLVFEIFVLDLESCFPFITFINLYLIISIDKIQLNESSYSAKPIEQLTNQRQQILVFDSDIVKTLIIYKKIKVSIWLSIKKNECSGGEFKRLNEANGQIDFDVNLQSLQLYWLQAINWAKLWLLIFSQFDSILIYSSVFWKFHCIFR